MDNSSDEAHAVQESKKKPKATGKKLEDEINLQHLQELMKVFHEADENGSDGLDIDEFKAAFGEILGQGKSEQQMAILFMKIDTNCDGTVDWDEFCTYMLLEYQEKDTMNRGGRLPYPYPLRVIHSPHRDNIVAIRSLPTVSQSANSSTCLKVVNGDKGRYVTASKDGVVCIWKSNLTLSRTFTLEPVRQKSIWVTDLTTMPNANKIVISSTENIVFFYDLSAASEPLHLLTGLPSCVVAMQYWFNPKSPEGGVLLLGDTAGGVMVIQFNRLGQGLFVTSEGGKQDCNKLTFGELVTGKVDHVKVWHQPQVHKDWTQGVLYCPSLEGVISCSCDSSTALVISDLHGRRDSTYFKIPKGVNSFDYSASWNVIATGGLDRKVRLWNPYVPTKPTAVLLGHSNALLYVAFNDKKNQLLSFSKEKELRVWDVQDQTCLQICQKFDRLGPQPPYAFLCHQRTSLLMMATNRLALMEPSGGGELFISREVVTHSKPVCAALYNPNFNQVVSGCHGGTVSVWDAETGAKVMQFTRSHGDAEITAMTFDPSGRRLITGARDGSIKIWNFNNGACLGQLTNQDRAEVTSIVFLKQRIIVGGWNRRLAVYSDSRGPESGCPKYWGEKAHQEDILCMAQAEPNLLISASYDGDVVVWNADSEHISYKMNAKHYCRRRSSSASEDCPPPHQRASPGLSGSAGSFGHAVEKVLLLASREHLTGAAMLVTCGTGGWVRFWNIQGRGLLGEFSVFSQGAGQGPVTNIDTVTACCTDRTESNLYTGDSLGYVLVWCIAQYCTAGEEEEVLRDPPPRILSFRAHMRGVVSLSISDQQSLLVTGSVDGCVRLWTTAGLYIGTFGELYPWQLPSPIRSPSIAGHTSALGEGSNLDVGIPQDAIKTQSGHSISKWKLAFNLFRALKKQTPKIGDEQVGEASKVVKEQYDEEGKRLLGKYYRRKTRPRRPIKPIKPHQNGSLVLPFTTLKCSEMREPPPLLPPIPMESTLVTASNHAPTPPLKERRFGNQITVHDILPDVEGVAGRAGEGVAGGGKKVDGWRRLHRGVNTIKKLKTPCTY